MWGLPVPGKVVLNVSAYIYWQAREWDTEDIKSLDR